MESGRNIGQSE